MVQIDISMPQSCDDCPFLLVDYKTNVPDCDLMEDLPNCPEYDWNTPMGQRDKNCPLMEAALLELPFAQPEPLTDKEQRIFLAAMSREEKVCKQVDEECRDCKEPYEDSLVSLCREIIRKVKAALWET